MAEVFIDGADEFKRAIARNPENARQASAIFLHKVMAGYRRIIDRSPWKMGQTGGGSPIAAINGGRLRRTHRYVIGPFEGRIYPTAPYAPYVHGIDGIKRKRSYQLRPWLDFAVTKNAMLVGEEQKVLLKAVTRGLAT